jgi:Protein kinase domain
VPRRTNARRPASRRRFPGTAAGKFGHAHFARRKLELTADRPGKDEHVGSVLAGKYKLIEEIGEGGMGSVYMAQQTEPVRRAVAVKVIKAGMDSKAVLPRFTAERQALAMMDHPNIAKVLDARATVSGPPCSVMELVKGVPNTECCDARKLTPRQRLELFVSVCHAVQHAHQKGIIHRDIKPSVLPSKSAVTGVFSWKRFALQARRLGSVICRRSGPFGASGCSSSITRPIPCSGERKTRGSPPSRRFHQLAVRRGGAVCQEAIDQLGRL